MSLPRAITRQGLARERFLIAEIPPVAGEKVATGEAMVEFPAV
jgi:hypothetical protein